MAHHAWFLGRALLVIVALLAPCGSEERSRVATADVLAIGDSILVGADEYGDLRDVLSDRRWRVEIVAKLGEPTHWGVDQVERLRAVPDVVVVVLGSNPSPALGSFIADVETLHTALVDRGADRILWVPPVGKGRRWDYTEKVGELRRLARQLDEIEVLDWDLELRKHPRWFAEDDLHLDEAGYRALSRKIAEAAGRP